MIAFDTSSSVARGCFFVTRPMLSGTPPPVQHPELSGFRRSRGLNERNPLSCPPTHDTIRTVLGQSTPYDQRSGHMSARRPPGNGDAPSDQLARQVLAD